MHRRDPKNLEQHEVDLDVTPPSSPVGWPLMASSPRVRRDALPFLIPDVGVWNDSTPSLLSADISYSGDKIDTDNETFLLDSLVASLCIDSHAFKHRGIRPPPSIDASPVPSPSLASSLSAYDEPRWLDSGMIPRSVSSDSDLLEVESMAPAPRRQGRYEGNPQYRSCRMTACSLLDNCENRFVSSIYTKGAYCNIFVKSSKGRPLRLNGIDSEQVALHVSALLTAGLIQKWRRTAFVSYPFVVPKATGGSRLIVDFAHLRNKYSKPALHLPAFPAVLRRLYPIRMGDMMARIDLQSAFYNVPIPARLRDVPAFRFNNDTFVFNVLPMGLFLSPVILQDVVQDSVRQVIPGPTRNNGLFAWVHLDDILLCADSEAKLQNAVRQVVRKLNQFGFFLAVKKSVLKPTQLIKYCGLLIDTRRAQYEVATSRLNFFKEMLRSPQRFSKQAWGYLAFWIYALGMSSIVRLLNFASRHVLISILESGPWPLPRPPERIWASDASKQFIAVVAPTQLIFRGCAFGEHIFENELLGAFVAAFLHLTVRQFCAITRRSLEPPPASRIDRLQSPSLPPSSERART